MLETEEILVRHKLNVDDYHRMAEAGILDQDDRVELIEGELIDMAPIGQDHAATVNGLTELLVLAAKGRAIVSVQNSFRLDRLTEPQPDFVVLRPRQDRYRTGEKPARPTFSSSSKSRTEPCGSTAPSSCPFTRARGSRRCGSST